MKRKYHKDVHYVCKLKAVKNIERIYGKLKNKDIVLTDERKKHIIERRGKDAKEVLDNLYKTLNDYDFIFCANSGCIKFVKMSDSNYSFVVKLSIKNHIEGNSVISGMKITTNKVNKYILKDIIIDSKL